MNIEKQKLINAIKYINCKVEDMSIMKLNKLLFLFDLNTFKASGNIPTGQWYFTESNGPALKTVNKMIKKNNSDFFEGELKFDLESKDDYFKPLTIESSTKFNDIYFTEEQVEILEDVIEEFGKMTAQELSDYTHQDGSIYSLAVDKNNGSFGNAIDFRPSLRDSDASVSVEYVNDETGYNIENAS